jgi:hypothetical protein
MALSPPRWSLDDFVAGVERGIEVFRTERLAEARTEYVDHYDTARQAVQQLFADTRNLRDLVGNPLIAQRAFDETVRYLTAPPISEDDLESVSGVQFRHNSRDQRAAVIATVWAMLDIRRFPWLSQERDPTQAERHAAIVSTSAQIASRRVMTDRANVSKTTQENLVKEALRLAGFTEVPARTITTLRTMPSPGQFCGESQLGTRKADVVVGLWDARCLAIECKVSNSSTNSVKRIKNDAAVKAVRWINEFGTQLIVPAAIIAGVFNPLTLQSAQDDGLHDLQQMIDWVERAR